jgi:hypothetical protein
MTAPEPPLITPSVPRSRPLVVSAAPRTLPAAVIADAVEGLGIPRPGFCPGRVRRSAPSSGGGGSGSQGGPVPRGSFGGGRARRLRPPISAVVVMPVGPKDDGGSRTVPAGG